VRSRPERGDCRERVGTRGEWPSTSAVDWVRLREGRFADGTFGATSSISAGRARRPPQGTCEWGEPYEIELTDPVEARLLNVAPTMTCGHRGEFRLSSAVRRQSAG
jgi:hypothetical protein